MKHLNTIALSLMLMLICVLAMAQQAGNNNGAGNNNSNIHHNGNSNNSNLGNIDRKCFEACQRECATAHANDNGARGKCRKRCPDKCRL